MEGLATGVMAFVIEPQAVAVIERDIHGFTLCGIANLPHVKSATRLAKFVTGIYRENGVVLHSHDQPGTFGRKLAEHFGYVEDGDAMWLNVGGI